MFMRQIIGIVGNSKKSFSLLYIYTPLIWSVISTLLHLVGLRPRVYSILTNFRGVGQGPLNCSPPPHYANALSIDIPNPPYKISELIVIMHKQIHVFNYYVLYV